MNLELFVFFDSLQYTKISQTPKKTLSALISNLGGSTGLFLDLSFMSVCRAIEFFLGIIFKILMFVYSNPDYFSNIYFNFLFNYYWG